MKFNAHAVINSYENITLTTSVSVNDVCVQYDEKSITIDEFMFIKSCYEKAGLSMTTGFNSNNKVFFDFK